MGWEGKWLGFVNHSRAASIRVSARSDLGCTRPRGSGSARGFARMGASSFTLCDLGGELASFRNSGAGRSTAPEVTHLWGATPARRMQACRHRAILLSGPGYGPDSRDRRTAGGYILNRRQFVAAAACAAGVPALAAASPAASREPEWLPDLERLETTPVRDRES